MSNFSMASIHSNTAGTPHYCSWQLSWILLSATSEDFLAEKIAENKHILILFLYEMWCENLSRKSECLKGISTSWGPNMLLAFILNPVQLFATPWTVACQAPLSLRLSWEVYWSGLPFSRAVDLPNSGTEPTSPTSPALQVDSFITELPGKPCLLAPADSFPR